MTNPWLTLGQCLEPAILEAGRRILGWEIEDFCQTDTLVHDRIDWVRCTPDGYRIVDGRRETVNAKNVSVNNDRYMDYRNGTIPHDHTLAAHWEMLVTGNDRAYILALVGGAEVVPFTIERDDVVIRGLFNACAKFRARYLVGDHEPPPDASDVTARAFRDRAEYEPGTKVYLADVSPDADSAAMRVEELAPQMKALKEEHDRCRNVIRAAMKNAQIGVASSGRSFRWSKSGSLI